MVNYLQVHVAQNSTIPDHCIRYALSFNDDADYNTPCDHEHKERCDRCDIFPAVVKEVETVLDNLEDGGVKDEMKHDVSYYVEKIQAWKAHLLRSINQDQARLDILQGLNPESALLVLDWAMKFLPRKFREAQSDLFGKRGISWHITVAIRKTEDGKMQMLTFVHVFEKCIQESDTVLAIIDDVFSQLKSVAPEIKTVFLRQDNAGCYHSTSILLSVQRLATKNNIHLSRVDYSDPQGGKGSCDRKAATIKSHIKVYLNEGHDVETPEQMVAAIESLHGVPGVRVTLCGQQTSQIPFPVTWEGISFLNNMELNDKGIRVWRAYGIGPGKFLPWENFGDLEDHQLPTLNTVGELSARTSSTSFTDVTARRSSSKKSGPDQHEINAQLETADDNSDHESQDLFFCPEEGCIKSFQRYSSFQNHIDCGQHKYVLERETLYDKAIMMYAGKLEQGACCDVPPISVNIPTMLVDEPTTLKIGWSLKHTKQRKRHSEKQKKYLLDIYQIGQETGQKADPVSVSKSMRKAKLSNGEPMSIPSEFLTSQQIASFFSRVTAKKKKCQDHVEFLKDQQEVEQAKLLQDMQSQVLDVVSIHHPIMHDTYNLCDYASRKKFDRFSILVLQDICSSFQLDVSNIKVKRKKPYIELIEKLCQKCTCLL